MATKLRVILGKHFDRVVKRRNTDPFPRATYAVLDQRPRASTCGTNTRSCAICLNACEDGQMTMPCCTALIHTTCMDEWIQQSLDTRCPYCRHDVEVPEEEKKVLEERRRKRKEVEENETSEMLRLRQECAQQIFDVFSATHRVTLDQDVVWSWIVDTQLRPVSRMLQEFEKWYQEHPGSQNRLRHATLDL